MKTLNMSVSDKILSFDRESEKIVCGNDDYQIEFDFDDEWSSRTNKTARFIWNNTYFDQEFTGNTCPIPPIFDTKVVKVGIYADDIYSTTTVVVDCIPAILGGREVANNETGGSYTNEAKRYAEQAKSAADEAKAVAENIGELKGDVTMNSVRLGILERKTGGELVTVVTVNKKKTYLKGEEFGLDHIPALAHILGSKSAKVQDDDDYFPAVEMYGEKMQPNYQRGFTDNYSITPQNPVTVTLPPAEEMQEICPFLGYGKHWYGGSDDKVSFISENVSAYANFIFFEGGKAYYYQGAEYIKDAAEYQRRTSAGEKVFDTVLSGGGDTVGGMFPLPEPIITDISDYVLTTDGEKSDGMFYIVPNGFEESAIEMHNDCFAEIIY